MYHLSADIASSLHTHTVRQTTKNWRTLNLRFEGEIGEQQNRTTE